MIVLLRFLSVHRDSHLLSCTPLRFLVPCALLVFAGIIPFVPNMPSQTPADFSVAFQHFWLYFLQRAALLQDEKFVIRPWRIFLLVLRCLCRAQLFFFSINTSYTVADFSVRDVCFSQGAAFLYQNISNETM